MVKLTYGVYMMSGSLKLERAPDLRDQAYARLRVMIMDGALAQGTRLTEAWAARELGISRTPAREALVMLTQDGLVSLDQKGFAIPLMSEADIRAVYEMRLLLEPPAVRWICTNVDPKLLTEVCAYAAREMDRHGEDQTDPYVRMVKRIRDRLYELLKNQSWRETIARFEAKARIPRFRTMQKDEVRRISMAGNRQLFHWLDQAHPEGAGAAMTLLLTSACQTTLESLAETKD